MIFFKYLFVFVFCGTFSLVVHAQNNQDSSLNWDFADQAISGVCTAIYETYKEIPPSIQTWPQVAQIMSEVKTCADKSKSGMYTSKNYENDENRLRKLLDYLNNLGRKN